MYLEYENTKKHESGGAIKIKKTDNNQAEIIDIKSNAESMKKNILSGKEINPEINNISSNGNIINNNETDDEYSSDFFSEEGFDLMPDIGKSAHSFLDYVEKVNISGYEGNYDDFVCMCFFTFENIFDLNNKFGMKTDEAFKNKILK